VHYFGRDLVLFRTAGGRAAMLDAHCAHLGAHLGHGGKIEGERIRCPFHGWAYDADGWCRDVPYSAMPPVCKREPVTHSYPLAEANGVIWAWYHPHDIAPLFDVETYPQFTDPSWAEQTRFEWRVATTPQEVAENAVDAAHFQFVHGTPAPPEGHGIYEGHIRRTGTDGIAEIEHPDGSIQEIKTAVRSWANGAGQKITMLQGVTTVWLMVLITPIEADDAELRFAFTHPRAEPGSREAAAFAEACERIAGETGVIADIPIWNHKIHRTRPLLCESEEQIVRFRRWFEQFYVYDEAPREQIAG
jgi:3-ketosteroid 9alpha-monooxygenase subunit A